MVTEISALDADRLRQTRGVQVVDVREPSELPSGRIEGVIHIPLNQLPASLHLLNQSQPVIVVCQAGIRSFYGTEYLDTQGFTDARNLTGGMDAWIEARLPVVF